MFLLSPELERVLIEKDWNTLKTWVREDRRLLRRLMKRIYVKDGIIFWRVVDALGIAAAELEKKEPGYAVELVRRYFWALNEESGGTAWNASEAIGSILAHCPRTCGHFNWMYSGLLEDETLREGALWGLVQLAQNAPELVEPLEERIRVHLEDSSSQIRGLASLICGLMEFKQGLDINLLEILSNDHSKVEIYQDGKLAVYQVKELWQPQKIYFWAENIDLNGLVTRITVASTSQGLCWLGFGKPEEETRDLKEWALRKLPKAFLIKRRKPNEQILTEVEEYVKRQRQEFSVSLHQIGTPFQLQVWDELRKIPYGKTLSYAEVAERLGKPGAQRAVGLANNKNPIGLVVPCHRVIGKNGNLTGYAGGIDIKQKLLEIEGAW